MAASPIAAPAAPIPARTASGEAPGDRPAEPRDPRASAAHAAPSATGDRRPPVHAAGPPVRPRPPAPRGRPAPRRPAGGPRGAPPPPSRAARDGRQDRGLGDVVEARRRLVEEQERGTAEERPGHADPPPLPAREARAALAEDQRRDPGRPARRPTRAARDGARPTRPGATRRTLSATVPANRNGTCGTQATPRPPGVAVEVAHVDRRPVRRHHDDPPAARLQKPRITARSVLLPAPARARDGHDLARPHVQRERRPARRRRGPAGRRDTPVDDQPPAAEVGHRRSARRRPAAARR